MTGKQTLDWRLFAVMYCLIIAAFAARAVLNADTMPLIADTDDAMRLVVVRDFLAGQGWYDNVQHRLNTPFGAEIHWSRLADLPVAALVLLFRPFLGTGAETAAAYVLPLLWLGALLFLCGKLSVRLVGPEGLLPALALPALSLSVLGEFAPGRIDHHSLQILLLMTMAWSAVEALERPRFAIVAGLAAATSLALGVEGLPSIAAAILAFGLMWIWTPARADALREFGLSLGLGALVHLAVALPPDKWLVPACDAISIAYTGAVAATGLVFAGLSMAPGLRSPLTRLAAGVGAGGGLMFALVVLFPDCMRGPYATLDPWLVDNWIDKISEALPLWTALLQDPVYPLAVAVPPALAIGVVGWQVMRGRTEDRMQWLVYAVFLLFAVVTMLVQIRASRMATPLAVPAAAWLIVAARHRYLDSRRLGRMALLLLSWIGAAGVAVAVVVIGLQALVPGGTDADAKQAGITDRRACVMPGAFTALAAMPAERVMTPIDLGSHMLAFTPHHVVAAPYHRNEGGVKDAFAFFNDPIAEGREILERRGISLVVTCDALPEMRGRSDAAEDSFVRLVQRDALPDWIVETTRPGEALRVFAVLPR